MDVLRNPNLHLKKHPRVAASLLVMAGLLGVLGMRYKDGLGLPTHIGQSGEKLICYYSENIDESMHATLEGFGYKPDDIGGIAQSTELPFGFRYCPRESNAFVREDTNGDRATNLFQDGDISYLQGVGTVQLVGEENFNINRYQWMRIGGSDNK